MNILIIGESGFGKSNFADILKNAIFKMDIESEILIDDPDREVKKIGNGKNIHNIKVRRSGDCQCDEECDVLIQIKNQKFKEWYNKI